MRQRQVRSSVIATAVVAVVGLGGVVGVSPVASASSGAAQPARSCTAGARTLAPVGSVMYPDTGNGGYVSVHTDVYLRYDTDTKQFLPGTHVVLSDRSTQCLSSLSLDLERSEAGDPHGSPNLHVRSVRVDGIPAAFRFEQPTYPGDPNGPQDPDPRAHEVSQDDPVGGPDHNPLPPACSPELTSSKPSARHSQDGQQCPANKLVITPERSIPADSAFTVDVQYVGRPGLHHDGDGSTEGWFMTPGGSSMSTEPVASEDWMPLNDYPTAKPSYDFFETAPIGKTVICNGRLVHVTTNPPDTQFPAGSKTWHWYAPMPIPSYLVLSMVGDYDLTWHAGPDGMRYYQAQDTHISTRQQRLNALRIARQPDITAFESRFNGPFPFSSDGAVAGVPGQGAAVEEMESMIVFTNGYVNTATLYHENMHQWWGDNVTEAGYEMTFFKEGLATLAQVLDRARHAQLTQASPTSFDDTLIASFDATYAESGSFWSDPPSHPAPYDLFDGDATYVRPGAAYIALWQILGRARFVQALHALQRIYGGASVTEAQLEAQFQRVLPNPSDECVARLGRFFTQWFDTGYASGRQPDITGPGLDGPNFYDGICTPHA